MIYYLCTQILVFKERRKRKKSIEFSDNKERKEINDC